jgi:type IV secretory pathway VirB2 component (pilin)
MRTIRNILAATTTLLLPIASYASGDIAVSSDPWDQALNAVLQIMTGATATTIGAIALAGTGYLFLRGRIDIMRLMAIVAGLGIIFGAPHLASLLQRVSGQ